MNCVIDFLNEQFSVYKEGKKDFGNDTIIIIILTIFTSFFSFVHREQMQSLENCLVLRFTLFAEIVAWLSIFIITKKS